MPENPSPTAFVKSVVSLLLHHAAFLRHNYSTAASFSFEGQAHEVQLPEDITLTDAVIAALDEGPSGMQLSRVPDGVVVVWPHQSKSGSQYALRFKLTQ